MNLMQNLIPVHWNCVAKRKKKAHDTNCMQDSLNHTEKYLNLRNYYLLRERNYLANFALKRIIHHLFLYCHRKSLF